MYFGKETKEQFPKQCLADQGEWAIIQQTKIRKQKLFKNLQKLKYLRFFRQLNNSNALWWLSRQKARQFLGSLEAPVGNRKIFVSYNLKKIHVELKHV